MSIEIEKKYRLTRKQHEALRRRLPEIGAKREDEEFEENTLYDGGPLEVGRCILRLRRVGKRAILTYKERLPSSSPIKQQLEDETLVSDADAMEAILESLGFTPALIYEKRRATWNAGGAQITLDELPFGLFMEIEGPEDEIRKIERRLALKGLRAEHATYPQLTQRHGEICGPVVEARFENPRTVARKGREKKRKSGSAR